MRFGLGINLWPHRFPGRHKPILAEAMRGVLPEPIRTRRHKGNFNEVYFLGLIRNRAQLEELVRNAPLAESDMLDREILLECLEKACLGVAGDASGQDRLNLTLSLLKWLSMHEAWANLDDSPTQTVRWSHDATTGQADQWAF